MEDAVLPSPPASLPIVVEPNLTLFTHYSVEFQRHEVTCDLCGTDIALTAGGRPARFLQHRNKINCQKQARRRALEQDQARAAEIRETIGTTAVQGPSALVTSLVPALMQHRQPTASATTTPTATPAVSAPTSSFNSPHAQSSLLPATDTLLVAPEVDNTSLSTTLPTLSNLSLVETQPAQPGRRVHDCPGVLVEWEAGSIWSTYPYHRHSVNSLRWEPVAFENDRWLRIRSEACTRIVAKENSVCPACIAVPTSLEFTRVMQRALSAAEHTPWLALTYDQIHMALQKTTAKYRQLRLKYRNAERKLSTMRRRISDNQRLVMLLATHDVKRLRSLLSVALRKGASPQTLMARIEDSVAGLYTPRGDFDDRDFDIAFLAKALGGPRLLYALAHSHGLPSKSALGRRSNIPHLLPCVGKPTEDEISANITSLCNPECRPSMFPPLPPGHVAHDGVEDQPDSRPTTAGLILMIDGIALEERCRYSSERNCIVGLCREHSANVHTRVTSLDVIKTIEAALHGHDGGEPKCCYGKDGTVAAVAPYARTDHYTPVPLLLSPSCKTETGEELADTIRVFVHTWHTHPCGERVHGPLWALGSDGESSFRRARFLLCMSEHLDHASPLGRLLHGLRGFNCYTGPRGLVGTCDPKHVIKRFATLLRNPKGIMIHETLLTCNDIFTHLCELPGMTAEKARQLLDPADKQNVPKAINLLQALLKIKTDAPKPTLPSHAHRQHTVSFLAQTFAFFFLPFISVNMSLSDQISSLATYAHLIAALWIHHRTKSITGALYADSQAIVKNIIITVARLQLVDNNLPFYIILEGTDRLEGLFGDCRTQDHSRNFDAQQLSEKLTTSTLIQGVFERNPDLDSGHRRLSLKDAMGIDHVNPRSWKASVRVGDVELAAEWAHGREQAEKLLKSYFGPSASVDFDVAFPVGADRDLLRPLGDYVGCSYDPDDLRTDTDTPEAGAPHGSQAEATMESTSSTLPHGQAADQDSFDDEPEGMGIDDFLPRQEGRRLPASANSALVFNNDNFLEVEGKKYLKSSIVTIFLTAKRSRKVVMRILRARGVTIEDLRGNVYEKFNRNDLDGTDLVKCGDIAAALIRVGGAICLAVVEIAEIQIEGDKTQRVTAVELEEMEAADAHVKVQVQVLKMHLAQREWLWNHQYAALYSEKSTPPVKTPRHSLLVPGPLLFPLGPRVVPVLQPESEHGPGSQGGSTSPITWSLSDVQLNEVLDAAWNALQPSTDEILANINLLPSVAKCDGLPYQDEDGAAFLVRDVPEYLTAEKLGGKQKVPCRLCGETMELSHMRNHVGHHILYSMRDVPDDVELNQNIGIEPCGFCGCEDTSCRTRLSKKGGSLKVSSSCRYHYAAMSYAAACKTTSATPSTNVPIHCPFCPSQPLSGEPQTIWKYNAITHLLIHHQDEDMCLPSIPPQFLVDMHISKAEEHAMGIAEESTDDWRAENNVPDSDGIEAAHAEVAAGLVVQKRARAQSTAEAGRRRKTVRKT